MDSCGRCIKLSTEVEKLNAQSKKMMQVLNVINASKKHKEQMIEHMLQFIKSKDEYYKKEKTKIKEVANKVKNITIESVLKNVPKQIDDLSALYINKSSEIQKFSNAIEIARIAKQELETKTLELEGNKMYVKQLEAECEQMRDGNKTLSNSLLLAKQDLTKMQLKQRRVDKESSLLKDAHAYRSRVESGVKKALHRLQANDPNSTKSCMKILKNLVEFFSAEPLFAKPSGSSRTNETRKSINSPHSESSGYSSASASPWSTPYNTVQETEVNTVQETEVNTQFVCSFTPDGDLILAVTPQANAQPDSTSTTNNTQDISPPVSSCPDSTPSTSNSQTKTKQLSLDKPVTSWSMCDSSDDELNGYEDNGGDKGELVLSENIQHPLPENKTKVNTVSEKNDIDNDISLCAEQAKTLIGIDESSSLHLNKKETMFNQSNSSSDDGSFDSDDEFGKLAKNKSATSELSPVKILQLPDIDLSESNSKGSSEKSIGDQKNVDKPYSKNSVENKNPNHQFFGSQNPIAKKNTSLFSPKMKSDSCRRKSKLKDDIGIEIARAAKLLDESLSEVISKDSLPQGKMSNVCETTVPNDENKFSKKGNKTKKASKIITRSNSSERNEEFSRSKVNTDGLTRGCKLSIPSLTLLESTSELEGIETNKTKDLDISDSDTDDCATSLEITTKEKSTSAIVTKDLDISDSDTEDCATSLEITTKEEGTGAIITEDLDISDSDTEDCATSLEITTKEEGTGAIVTKDLDISDSDTDDCATSLEIRTKEKVTEAIITEDLDISYSDADMNGNKIKDEQVMRIFKDMKSMQNIELIENFDPTSPCKNQSHSRVNSTVSHVETDQTVPKICKTDSAAPKNIEFGKEYEKNEHQHIIQATINQKSAQEKVDDAKAVEEPTVDSIKRKLYQESVEVNRTNIVKQIEDTGNNLLVNSLRRSTRSVSQKIPSPQSKKSTQNIKVQSNNVIQKEHQSRVRSKRKSCTEEDLNEKPSFVTSESSLDNLRRKSVSRSLPCAAIEILSVPTNSDITKIKTRRSQTTIEENDDGHMTGKKSAKIYSKEKVIDSDKNKTCSLEENVQECDNDLKDHFVQNDKGPRYKKVCDIQMKSMDERCDTIQHTFGDIATNGDNCSNQKQIIDNIESNVHSGEVMDVPCARTRRLNSSNIGKSPNVFLLSESPKCSQSEKKNSDNPDPCLAEISEEDENSVTKMSKKDGPVLKSKTSRKFRTRSPKAMVPNTDLNLNSNSAECVLSVKTSELEADGVEDTNNVNVAVEPKLSVRKMSTQCSKAIQKEQHRDSNQKSYTEENLKEQSLIVTSKSSLESYNLRRRSVSNVVPCPTSSPSKSIALTNRTRRSLATMEMKNNGDVTDAQSSKKNLNEQEIVSDVNTDENLFVKMSKVDVPVLKSKAGRKFKIGSLKELDPKNDSNLNLNNAKSVPSIKISKLGAENTELVNGIEEQKQFDGKEITSGCRKKNVDVLEDSLSNLLPVDMSGAILDKPVFFVSSLETRVECKVIAGGSKVDTKVMKSLPNEIKTIPATAENLIICSSNDKDVEDPTIENNQNHILVKDPKTYPSVDPFETNSCLVKPAEVHKAPNAVNSKKVNVILREMNFLNKFPFIDAIPATPPLRSTRETGFKNYNSYNSSPEVNFSEAEVLNAKKEALESSLTKSVRKKSKHVSNIDIFVSPKNGTLPKKVRLPKSGAPNSTHSSLNEVKPKKTFETEHNPLKQHRTRDEMGDALEITNECSSSSIKLTNSTVLNEMTDGPRCSPPISRNLNSSTIFSELPSTIISNTLPQKSGPIFPKCIEDRLAQLSKNKNLPIYTINPLSNLSHNKTFTSSPNNRTSVPNGIETLQALNALNTDKNNTDGITNGILNSQIHMKPNTAGDGQTHVTSKNDDRQTSETNQQILPLTLNKTVDQENVIQERMQLNNITVPTLSFYNSVNSSSTASNKRKCEDVESDESTTKKMKSENNTSVSHSVSTMHSNLPQSKNYALIEQSIEYLDSEICKEVEANPVKTSKITKKLNFIINNKNKFLFDKNLKASIKELETYPFDILSRRIIALFERGNNTDDSKELLSLQAKATCIILELNVTRPDFVPIFLKTLHETICLHSELTLLTNLYSLIHVYVTLCKWRNDPTTVMLLLYDVIYFCRKRIINVFDAVLMQWPSVYPEASRCILVRVMSAIVLNQQSPQRFFNDKKNIFVKTKQLLRTTYRYREQFTLVNLLEELMTMLKSERPCCYARHLRKSTCDSLSFNFKRQSAGSDSTSVNCCIRRALILLAKHWSPASDVHLVVVEKNLSVLFRSSLDCGQMSVAASCAELIGMITKAFPRASSLVSVLSVLDTLASGLHHPSSLTSPPTRLSIARAVAWLTSHNTDRCLDILTSVAWDDSEVSDLSAHVSALVIAVKDLDWWKAFLDRPK